jgi:hypothetical protein
MTNLYLEKLRALEKSKTGHPHQLPKLPKPGFDSYDSDQGYPVLENAFEPQGRDISDKSPTFGRLYRSCRTFSELERRCPDHIDRRDWQQAVTDGRAFLARWGEQAEALGWTARDLFGLGPVPEDPAPSYRRLSRYDLTGLVWLLRGSTVVALTDTTAAIQHATGNVTIYRKHNKPALGPLGDSLDDLIA